MDIPWIDVVATKTHDSVYLSIINRHHKDSIHTFFNFDTIIPNTKAIVYELSSNHYLDHNSIHESNKVIPKQKSWTVSKSYNMPPHSFTILAIPINGIIKVDEPSISQKFDYTVNPNPVIELLNIIANSEIDNIKIYNILGKLVFEEFTPNNQASINLDYLPNGLYIIDIKNKKTTFIKN